MVRAIDSSANVDPTPGGYSFTVAATLPGGGAAPGAGPSPLSRAAIAPQTTLLAKPAARTRDRTPTFRFRADQAGTSFECAVDRGAFRPCRSPFTTRALSFGRHVFKVRARDDSGQTDPSPAAYGFSVLPRRG